MESDIGSDEGADEEAEKKTEPWRVYNALKARPTNPGSQ